ncbi:MAG: DUF883 C-terminal domain-containing protein [Legionella sp.]|uniref:hypothetical protein n=1 Tax=Legionella sp. TaxID=459 RepID=UPI0039E633A2
MDTVKSKPKAHITNTAEDLINEGLKKAHQTEESIKECSDQLLRKVQENPLTSVLIAGAVGFLLAKILRK